MIRQNRWMRWFGFGMACVMMAGMLSPRTLAQSGAAEESTAAETAETAGNAAEESTEISAETLEQLTFGVSVYDINDAEVQMFKNYFENYLGLAFETGFVYSESIGSSEDELAFIDALHEQGVPGLISFYAVDLEPALTRCDEYGMYYLLGSGSISDEEFTKASAHESFLGILGPDQTRERAAGSDMAKSVAGKVSAEAPAFLIFSGGAALGNEMHKERTAGILHALEETCQLTLHPSVDELLTVTDVTDVDTGDSPVQITICPGYFHDGVVAEKLGSLLTEKNYDAALGALTLNYVLPVIEEEESRDGYDMLIGMVDAFSDQTFEWFMKPDASGDTTINYLVGKYGATVGPAFAAMYNACTGHADFLKEGGAPFRFVQPFWVAEDVETFEELYDKSVNVYDNIYSITDLMSIIKIYNPEATFADFKALAEKDWLSE